MRNKNVSFLLAGSFIALALAGCQDKSGAAPQAAATPEQNSTPVTDKVEPAVNVVVNSVLSEVGESDRSRATQQQAACSFETIGGKRPAGASIDLAGLDPVGFVGWVVNEKAKQEAVSASIRFKDAGNSKVWIAPIGALEPRVDVAKHLGIDGAIKSQFNVGVSLAGLPKGTYEVSVAQMVDGGAVAVCERQHYQIVI